MFKGSQPNPYDDIVNKTTDENLTGENWELILNLCDKVIDEGEQGARNVIAAVLKRLAHRNPNVQLYALSLAESLSKNCGLELHREIASRAFTQGLEKIITDRTTHDRVKRRALVLIAQWTAEFENDSSLGVMEECYNNLKLKNYKFEAPQEPPPPTVDDEVRRREEEELQRILALSIQDKGGRTPWDTYSSVPSNGAGGSGASNLGRKPSTSIPTSLNSPQVQSGYTPPTYHTGYVPARTPSPNAQSPVLANVAPVSAAPAPVSAPVPSHSAPAAEVPAPITSEPIQGQIPVVTRVRALHAFVPTEAGELAFDKGDVIKVVDRGYKDWWRGQLKGRTGIFPVNYVEPLPEPTAAELAKEAEQEAAVFTQAVNVDKLLTMLRALDPAKDNLADNEEIQELYRSSMALRPKIVKLIDKYSQKRADLVSMNESFVKARTIFDRMMEDSLAIHSGFYEQSRPNYRTQASAYQGRSDSRGAPPVGAQPFGGWNPGAYDQPGYNAYPAGASPYPQGPERPYQGPPQPVPQPQPQPYVDPSVYAQQQAGYVQQPYGASPYPPGQSQPQPQVAPQQIPHQQQQFSPSPQPLPQLTPQLQQPQPQQPSQSQQAQAQQPIQTQQALQRQQSAQAQQPVQTQQGAQTQQPAQAAQSPQSAQAQQPAQQLPQAQQPTKAQQPQQPVQAQAQPQTQQASSQQQQSGPPYVYDPNGTYADPNVQAWAHYYAQGGQDLAGSVYFISVPGVTESPPASGSQDNQPSQQTQPQPQPQHDTTVHSSSTPSPTNADAYQAYPGHTQQPINDTAAYGSPSQSQPQPDSSVVPGSAAQGSHVYDAAASTSSMAGDVSATQPPWARPTAHGQPMPNTGSPNPQSQQHIYQPGSVAPLSPTQSFHSAQPQGGQLGWHSQYNTMQSHMGVMDIVPDGIGQHPGQQQAQQPYQGVGAPA